MISPVEKILKTNNCGEFRLINTLKTCEKVIKEQLEAYMERHKLFTKYKLGIKRNFLCETTVNYLINRWKFISKKEKIMATVSNFKRVFGAIDRKILIKKLNISVIKENKRVV